MRVLIVEQKTLHAHRLTDEFDAELGVSVVGPARSSGEAFLLAIQQQPDAAVVNVDLESCGAGRRLAQKLEAEMRITCFLVGDCASDQGVTFGPRKVVSAVRDQRARNGTCDDS